MALGAVGLAAVLVLLIVTYALLARSAALRITQQDLAVEARSLGVSPNGPAEGVLRDSVLTRKLLAREARRRGFDRRPDFPSVRNRAVELALSKELIESLPPPSSPNEAALTAYINGHPGDFAERWRWSVDALTIPSAAAASAPDLSWDDLVSRFASANVAVAPRAFVILSSDVSPALRKALGRGAPGSVVTMPDGLRTTVYRVTSSEPAPLEGDAARAAAREALRHEARQAQVADLIRRLRGPEGRTP